MLNLIPFKLDMGDVHFLHLIIFLMNYEQERVTFSFTKTLNYQTLFLSYLWNIQISFEIWNLSPSVKFFS